MNDPEEIVLHEVLTALAPHRLRNGESWAETARRLVWHWEATRGDRFSNDNSAHMPREKLLALLDVLESTGSVPKLTRACRELIQENDRLREVVRVNELCHDSELRVGAEEFCRGCASYQRRLFGRAPHEDALCEVRHDLENAITLWNLGADGTLKQALVRLLERVKKEVKP